MDAIVIRILNLPKDKPVGRDCHVVTCGGGKQIVCSNGDYEEEKINKSSGAEMIIETAVKTSRFIFMLN